MILTMPQPMRPAGTPALAEVEGKATLAGKKNAGGFAVWLQGEKRAKPLSKAAIDQRDKLFQPHISMVTVGTTVDFPNNDSVFHNVFAYYRAKKFDLGMYPRGKTMKVNFDHPGIVALHCNVHSEMSAYIVVVDTPFFAVSDKAGRFTLRNVEPGVYQMHIWHESGVETVQKVILHAGTNALAPQSSSK